MSRASASSSSAASASGSDYDPALGASPAAAAAPPPPPAGKDGGGGASIPPPSQEQQQQQGASSKGGAAAEAHDSSMWSSASSTLTSYLWPWGSSSSDPSSSSSTDAPSSKPPLPRRPSYEEFRRHEPPQARLIRLRGLFDKLLDKSGESALANGRAKDAWTKSAIRARLGAGLKAEDNSAARSAVAGSASTPNAGGAAQTSSATAGAGSSSSRKPDEQQQPELHPSALPQPSYATELLAQCKRSHREGLGSGSNDASAEAERKRAAQVRKEAVKSASSTSSTSSSSSSSSATPTSPSASAPTASASTSATSLPLPLSGRDRAADAGRDGEAGWVGSGVWGLTAVSLDHLEDVPAPSSSSSSAAAARSQGGSGSSSSAGTAKTEDLSPAEQKERAEREEAEGLRQRRIEWEGFLKYAEEKERELYNIFQDLDKNGDGILDIGEIRAALERAGIDLGSVPLEDFTASMASSRYYPSAPAPTVAGLAEGSMYVTFPEFRDYLLLLPRKATMPEIFRFYQVRKAFGLFVEGGVFEELGRGWGKTKRGAAVVNFDGDVSLAGEEKMKGSASSSTSSTSTTGPSGSGAAAAAAAAGPATGATTAAQTNAQGVNGGLRSSGAPHKSSSHPHHHHGAGHSSEGDDHMDASDGGSGNGGGIGKAAGADHHGAHVGDDAEGEEEEDDDRLHPDIAVKFLLAGGIAGAVSRTATAPFDRLKVYLITSARSSASSELLAPGGPAAKAVTEAAARAASAGGGGVVGAVSGASAGVGTAAAVGGQAAYKGAGMLRQAIVNLYKEGGGLKAFWIGNGLNVVKIFPESAIKFMSYEMSKRAFAKYVDHVSDSRDISGTSRFLSGGIGGITSQLAIYPVETLKTRLMASQQAGKSQKLLLKTARDMWQSGGVRLYYRGLTAGLIGVFPYSAIDMSAFEGIKLFYIKYTGKEEPGVLALLAFGSISGSVGATTVYPLNLIRTRLQAAGTPAHPQTYEGFLDAVKKTYKNEGGVGFYRGLVPTLAKVVPAVSISYVVYEH
ncbi:hypothetical protein OC834_006407, partial [Tilletia horrida]